MLPALTYHVPTITQHCRPPMNTCVSKHSSSLYSLSVSCPSACWTPYFHCATPEPASMTMQITEIRTQKTEASLLPHGTFLCQVRGHFPSLCQNKESGGVGGGGATDRGRNKEKADESSHQCPPHPRESTFPSAWHCWELQINLNFYSKGETYAGNF